MAVLMLLLFAVGVVLIGLLVWAAMSASEETTQRERRIERDLDRPTRKHDRLVLSNRIHCLLEWEKVELPNIDRL